MLDKGDDIRFERWVKGARVTISSPLGGLFPLELRNGQFRNLTTESGILDWGVRSGPLALLLVLFIPVTCRRRLYRVSYGWTDSICCEHRDVVFLSATIIFSCCIFANIWINTLSDPYLSPWLWSLMAFAASIPDNPNGDN